MSQDRTASATVRSLAHTACVQHGMLHLRCRLAASIVVDFVDLTGVLLPQALHYSKAAIDRDSLFLCMAPLLPL